MCTEEVSVETTMYMRIDGGRVRGSAASSPPYDRWIAIHSLEMGVERTGSGSAGAAEYASMRSCIIRKRPDLSSCAMLQMTAAQRPFRLEIHICASSAEGRGTAPRTGNSTPGGLS